MLYKGELYSYEVIGRFLWDSSQTWIDGIHMKNENKNKNKKKHALFHHWS